jgi:hypothetical protein
MATLKELQKGAARMQPFSFTRQEADGKTRTFRIAFKLLLPWEMDAARLSAEQYLRQKDPEGIAPAAHQDIREDSRIIEVLALAMIDPDDAQHPDVLSGKRRANQWAGPVEIRETLFPTEIDVLWAGWADFESSMSPRIRTMTSDQFEALVEALANEHDADPLVFCGARTRRLFLRSMAAELLTSRTTKPSPGSDTSGVEIAQSSEPQNESDASSTPYSPATPVDADTSA